MPRINGKLLSSLSFVNRHFPAYLSDAYGFNFEKLALTVKIDGPFTEKSLEKTISGFFSALDLPRENFLTACVTHIKDTSDFDPYTKRPLFHERTFTVEPDGKITLHSPESRLLSGWYHWTFFSAKKDFSAFRRIENIRTLVIMQQKSDLRPFPAEIEVNAYTRYRNDTSYMKELYTGKEIGLAAIHRWVSGESDTDLDASGYSRGLVRRRRKDRLQELRADRERSELRNADTAGMIDGAQKKLLSALTASRDAIDRIISALQENRPVTEEEGDAVDYLLNNLYDNGETAWSLGVIERLKRYDVAYLYADLDSLKYQLNRLNNHAESLIRDAENVLPVPASAE